MLLRQEAPQLLLAVAASAAIENGLRGVGSRLRFAGAATELGAVTSRTHIHLSYLHQSCLHQGWIV
jgi:hypothetical protein